MKWLLLLVAVATSVTGKNIQSYVVQTPSISLLKPRGLQITVPDEEGIQRVAVHYSINKPLEGSTPGEVNAEILKPTGDNWVHENKAVEVKPGDTVYFWHLVRHQGIGYQVTDQKWQAPSPKRKVHNLYRDRDTLRKAKRDSKSIECEEYPCLIFEDNFDYLDFSTWEHEITAGGGGNWEFQYYHNNRTNSYVRDGVLYIRPTLTEEKYGDGFVDNGHLELWGHQPASLCTGNQWWGCSRDGNPANIINPAQSARLRSAQSLNFRYGRVEVRARMPKGDWLWPAIWLLPRYDGYGGWPASGEIDIIESRGNLDLRDEQGNQRGHSYAGATLHWGPYDPYNGYVLTGGSRDGTWADEFHLLVLEWDEDSIRVFYDDDIVMDVNPPPGGFWELGDFDLPYDNNPWRYSENKMAPFDQEFYLIMNVAVGGTNGFFPDHWTNSPYEKPWSNESPHGPRDFWNGRYDWFPTWQGENAAMAVDYVRVFKMKADSLI